MASKVLKHKRCRKSQRQCKKEGLTKKEREWGIKKISVMSIIKNLLEGDRKSRKRRIHLLDDLKEKKDISDKRKRRKDRPKREMKG